MTGHTIQVKALKIFCALVALQGIVFFSVWLGTTSDESIPFDSIDWGSSAGNHIFFIGACDGNESFPGIELCAFETAARYNTDKSVYVVLSDEVTGCKPPRYFRQFTNMQFVKADLSSVFKGTPVEALWKSGIVQEGRYHHAHTSDLLRLVLLLRYGGTYLDSDVVCHRSIPNLPNFIILSRDDRVTGTILKYQKGHPFLAECLNDVANNYNGSDYTHSGPSLVTKIAKKESFCNDNNSKPLNEQRNCKHDMTLLPQSWAYPITHLTWSSLYDPEKYEEIQKLLDYPGFAIHCHRRMKSYENKEFNVDPRHPIYRIAEIHCPLSVENVLRHDVGEPYGKRS